MDYDAQEAIQHKVIYLFQRHHPHPHSGDFSKAVEEEGGTLFDTPDHFTYISYKRGSLDDHHCENDALEVAAKKHYIIKMLEHHADAIRLNHYHVPGERLSEFLLSLPHRPGKILEIKQFIPNTPA